MFRASSPVLAMLATVASPALVAGQADPDLALLGPFLDSVIVAEGVPGASFAIFDDEGVLFEHVSGVKNGRTREPVDRETVFEAASISKPVFAYAVLSLVLEGVVDLDDPLAAIVDQVPEVGYDPRSGSLTPRLLLSHQGGLPNWRSRLRFEAEEYDEMFAPEDTLRFTSDPGTEYRYSGEGYVLLQRVIEQYTSTRVGELIRRRVFRPLGMDRSRFLFDVEVRANSSYGHDADGVPDKWVIGVPLASSTLHTTASDLARFGVELASQLQRSGPYAMMADREVRVANEGDWSLSWGLGLGIIDDGARRFVYHGGNNVIFIADLLYGLDDDLGYALLTNSAKGQRVVAAMERRVFGRTIRR
jgi:CubicO group peptidase (beta-lactamase class C family)